MRRRSEAKTSRPSSVRYATRAFTVVLAASTPRVSLALAKDVYITNPMCAQSYCVNPVFPAMDTLPVLERMTWRKHQLSNVSRLMTFCGQFIDYDPALPMSTGSPEEAVATAKTLEERSAMGLPVRNYDLNRPRDAVEDSVVEQDREAARRYFAHLAGMGIEAWEHKEPVHDSTNPRRPCARSVARLVCHTFFPKAPGMFPVGHTVDYLRPCRNTCEHFLQVCGVECCDNSVSCVWESGPAATSHPRRTLVPGGREVLIESGYVDAEGPCEKCTGSMALKRSALALPAFVVGLAMA